MLIVNLLNCCPHNVQVMKQLKNFGKLVKNLLELNLFYDLNT